MRYYCVYILVCLHTILPHYIRTTHYIHLRWLVGWGDSSVCRLLLATLPVLLHLPLLCISFTFPRPTFPASPIPHVTYGMTAVVSRSIVATLVILPFFGYCGYYTRCCLGIAFYCLFVGIVVVVDDGVKYYCLNCTFLTCRHYHSTYIIIYYSLIQYLEALHCSGKFLLPGGPDRPCDSYLRCCVTWTR